MNPRRFARLLSAILPLLLFSGCTAVAGQTKAITDAVVSYGDYYIEVRDLAKQVRAEQKKQSSNSGTVEYTITAAIPDYTSLTESALNGTLPAPDFSATNIAAYQQQSSLALRKALESYALAGNMTAYIEIPLRFTLVSQENGWTAQLSSQSKLSIQQTVEGMVKTVLERDATYQANYARAQVAAALRGLLAEAFGGAAYTGKLIVSDIIGNGDGTYRADISFPDPETVYMLIGERYTASYNQPFYGDAISVNISADTVDEIDLTSAPQINASVVVSRASDTGECLLIDDGGIAAAVTAAKTKAEENAAVVVNGAWRVPPEEKPSSGKILEGRSKGNAIVFKTKSALGDYYYVRFYEISSEDISEEGTLTLGVFIKGGKSANLRLPTGYYRVECTVGTDWYGLTHLFGADGTVFNSENAIVSKSGYISTITFD